MKNQDGDTPIKNQSNLLQSTLNLNAESQLKTNSLQNFDDIPLGDQKPLNLKGDVEESQGKTNSTNFDQMPIGGKKFEFSEFPDEGEQPKKVGKKPPARLAKRMEEADKVKSGKASEAVAQKEVQIPQVPCVDEIPIGGKKFEFSQYPNENQSHPPKQVKKKEIKPKQKPKLVSDIAQDQTPANIDEIPIGGSKMPGQFDEQPIGKGNTFQMSEFPEGDQDTPVETHYTMEQKLKSKAVKLRLSGMEDLLVMLDKNQNDSELAGVEIGKLMKETNPACLEKILQCFKIWMDKDKKWGDDEAKLAIENGYINGKPNTKKLTVELADLMYDKSPDVVEMTIMVGLKGKTPKTLAGYIAMISELLSIYGMKRMKFMKPYMADIVIILNREKLAAVKIEGMNLLKECYKWLSKEVVDPLLKDLKEGLRKELDSFWESHDKGTVMAAPKDIQQANDGKPKKKVDAYELSQAVDVFKKYNEKFVEQVLKEEKWSEKVKLMQEFVNAANVPKLAHTEFRHISELTRRLINHSNFNVVLWDLKILATLAKGLRRHFFHTVKSQFANVIGKFRDKKTQMVEETFNTLNDFSYSISIEDVIEDVKEGLGDKAPNMKVNLINWIGKFVEKKVEEKDELPEKAADAIKTLFPTFEKLLTDGVADVRDCMVKNIGKMKILIGEDFFAVMDKKMNKNQASKMEQVKKEMPVKVSREKDSKVTPVKGGKKGGKEKTIENSSMIGNQGGGSINEEIQDLIPKMNHSDWQKRKESAEAIIEILNNNSDSKLNLSCIGDLLSTVKNRISDPNKNIVKYFVHLTIILFELMPDREVKNNGKNFMSALAEGLSDKVQANRIQISNALNKMGEIYGKEQLLHLLGSYLENDKDSRVEVLRLILENEENLQRTDTRQYPKGIIKGLTDKNKEIRNLSERLFEIIQEKVGIDVFKNLAKNERPAIAKDLNNIFSKFDSKNNTSIISKGVSPPKMKQPPISAKKSSQRSLSKGNKTHQQNSYDRDDDYDQKQMYSTIQANSSLMKSGVRSFIEGNDDFAPLKVLASERVQRQENDERTPWICDNIKDSQEEDLIQSINTLFKIDLAKKMTSMDHRKINEACQQILRLCRDISHQNEIREVYDLILKWTFIRLWGGNPAIQSIIEVLPQVMSILEKKKLAINDGEVDIVVAILREYFITGYMNEYKVSESLYTITKCLISLSSGDRLLRKILRQFTIELTSIHRHIRKEATSFYRDGLSKLIKNQLMQYVGNGSTLEEASRIKELKNDPEFVQLLYKRFHENVLDSFGFRFSTPPQNLTQIQQSRIDYPPQAPKKAEEQKFFQEPPRPVLNERRNPNSAIEQRPQVRNRSGNQKSNIVSHATSQEKQQNHQILAHPDHKFEEIMDISNYPMPHPASPLGKHLAKLHPPNDSIVNFFNTLLMQSGEKISVQLTTYAKVIFGSILQSVETLLQNRNQYPPEKILNQINLLQQAIKCKHIINNIGELLYFGTRFALLQLVYEDQHKAQISNELQQRGIDFKVEQFIKVINGVMLRILENACPQQTINILLRMLNYHNSMQYVSQKTISLIIKCLSRVANNYTVEINEQRTKEFMKMSVEYFHISNLSIGLEQFNPAPDEKLKVEETIIKCLKNILVELAKFFNEQIWNIYDSAMKESKYLDNHVGQFIQFLNIPYPDNSDPYQQEDQQIKRITELLSKTKTFDSGIIQLKKYIANNPQFNPNQFFTSRGFDQKFVMMVLTAIDPRKAKRTPTKRELREEKSQNSRRPIEQAGSETNIQDRIQRLKMKFDEIQPKPEEQQPAVRQQPVASTRGRDEDRNEERAAEIKRRIDEMKSRLSKN